ncbi:Pantothenate synthetase [Zhongshania aliphaticivorans]|uniref:Pantothenate synthetase n=1 Tax=Zhongshania aliphaticivorans TaxID=1470434 RepID=A0A5S9QUD2_9GAMM|nr:pantoate--beta-alanine ligase [Zhongshania aliphaticivorans]CAA0114768.1 Pantothenate synthetase [Zhongshania aliphaticivorans]CAA0123019.1 Pantothenate synthetase [Zhongshania aliphaticivorans]
MKTYSTAASLRAAINTEKRSGKTIAFVPTMGNLHEGHLRLVQHAKQHADIVVVSIFVNPLQFGANEDLSNYPRTLAADKEKLFAEGAQYLFLPHASEIYPEGMDSHTKISVPELSDNHCGASRPGHFTGVATIVAKLFNIVQPDTAVFGEKDFQQLSVIRKMVSDLCMPINIIGVATARAQDGLALSSRNGYLNTEQRSIAPTLHRVLQETREAIACGYDSYSNLEQHAKISLNKAGLKSDYFTICDARTLRPITGDTEEVVILAAAKLGTTRLIDNVTLNVNPSADWGMLAAN